MDPASDNHYPCLLDRIIGAGGKTDAYRGISPKEYRKVVLRDLKWLLNSLQFPRLDQCLPWRVSEEKTLHSRDDLARADGNPLGYLYPHVRRSVVNYGMRSLAGALTEGMNPAALAREIREVVVNFEPRFIPRSVVVEMLPAEFGVGKLAFTVKAQLWSLGGPVLVQYRSDHDLETGDCIVTEQE